jgi:hypothetical protein
MASNHKTQIIAGKGKQEVFIIVQDTTKFDRDYALEATMLGIFCQRWGPQPNLKGQQRRSGSHYHYQPN